MKRKRRDKDAARKEEQRELNQGGEGKSVQCAEWEESKRKERERQSVRITGSTARD